MKTAAEIRAEGRAMTPEQLTTIARVDATGYLELDSDREFTRFLESLDPLTMHPSGMPTAWAVQTAHEHLIPTIRNYPNTQRKAAS